MENTNTPTTKRRPSISDLAHCQATAQAGEHYAPDCPVCGSREVAR